MCVYVYIYIYIYKSYVVYVYIYIYIYIYITGPLFSWVEFSPMARRPGFISRSSHPKDFFLMVLDITLLNTQHYEVQIKGKVEQSRESNTSV